MYTIRIYYTTGNSFYSEDTSDLVGMSWNNLDAAREALKFIEEHNKAYKESRAFSYRNSFNIKDLEDCPWFTKEEHWDYSLFVPDDEGELKRISAFWCGYFENFHYGEIILESEAFKSY